MTYDRYGHLFPQGVDAADMARLEAAVLKVRPVLINRAADFRFRGKPGH